MMRRHVLTATACAAMALAATAHGQAPLFRNDVVVETGGTAVDLAFIELNNDGRLDVVVANTEGSITRLLNLGGTFFVLPEIPLGLTPTGIVAAELTGDGIVDLAVIGFSTEIFVLAGDGKGDFAAPMAIQQPGFSFGSVMRTADIDNDGDVDIVLNTPAEVLLNDGAGGFGESIAYPGSPIPTIQALGDLDGNGFDDIVTTNFNGGVNVTLNMGGGVLVQGPVLPAGPDVVFVEVADIDGDTLLDIVAANSVGGFEPAGETGTVAILRNLGDGQFAPAVFVEVGDDPRNIAIGDVNGDGRNDLVVTNTASGTLSIATARPDGTFESDVMVGNDPGVIALLDANDDGRLDVFMTRGGLGVLFNRTAPGDVNDDGVVNTQDLLVLLANWGPVDP